MAINLPIIDFSYKKQQTWTEKCNVTCQDARVILRCNGFEDIYWLTISYLGST